MISIGTFVTCRFTGTILWVVKAPATGGGRWHIAAKKTDSMGRDHTAVVHGQFATDSPLSSPWAILDLLTWDNVKTFLNSNFVSSGLGALAGAAGGAWAAQKIAERVKLRKWLLQEVRNSNAAIELAQGICSTYLNLKEPLTLFAGGASFRPPNAH